MTPRLLKGGETAPSCPKLLPLSSQPKQRPYLQVRQIRVCCESQVLLSIAAVGLTHLVWDQVHDHQISWVQPWVRGPLATWDGMCCRSTICAQINKSRAVTLEYSGYQVQACKPVIVLPMNSGRRPDWSFWSSWRGLGRCSERWCAPWSESSFYRLWTWLTNLQWSRV